MIDIGLVEGYGPTLLKALLVTVELSLASILGSIVPGFLFATFMRSRHRPLRWVGEAAVAVGRNIPSIIQLFIVFYVLPIAVGLKIPPFWAAGLAFAFNGSGYMAAIFQTGLDGVPKGQWEAAHALGIRKYRLYRKVIAPQALVLIIGPFMNELSRQIKSSSIAAAVAVQELLYAATSINSSTFDPFTTFTAIAAMYFVIILPFGLLARWTQARTNVALSV